MYEVTDECIVDLCSKGVGYVVMYVGLIAVSLNCSGGGGERADWYQPFQEHCAYVQA